MNAKKIHTFLLSQCGSFTLESTIVVPAIMCITHLFILFSFQLYVVYAHHFDLVAKLENVNRVTVSEVPDACRPFQTKRFLHVSSNQCTYYMSPIHGYTTIEMKRTEPQQLIRMIDMIMTHQNTQHVFKKP